MRTFELNGERFWNIERRGKTIAVSYGKVGGKATTRASEADDPASACRRYQDHIDEKLEAGYVETTRDDAPALDATGRALEQAVVEHPDELAAHMAFADWLSEQPEPRLQARGEFIRTQLALEDEALPAAQRRKLVKRQRELLAAHERDWLGWRLADLLYDGGDDWPGEVSPKALEGPRSYARGWLDRLLVHNLGPMTVQALLAGGAARLLRRLVFEDVDYRVYGYEELTDCPHLANVRYLEVRNVGPGDQLGGLVASLPLLEELRLASMNVRTGYLFPLLNLENLRVLHVEDAAEYDVKGLAHNPALGKLTHLSLLPSWVYRNQAPLIDLDGLRALVGSKHLESLTHLAVHRTDAGDEGVREIVRSGVLARLVELDLSHGCITDEGARALAASPDYGHLQKLVIEDNRLTEAGIRALRRKGLKLEGADDQQIPDDSGGYDDGYLYFDDDFDDIDEWE
jgi:uncharacterized protein (TIGR02996 family)